MRTAPKGEMKTEDKIMNQEKQTAPGAFGSASPEAAAIENQLHYTMSGNNGQAPLNAALSSSAKIKTSEPERFGTAQPTDCPPLPDEARIDPALGAGAGRWVDVYTNYARSISPMTPTTFHESAALWLASVAIARRLVLPMSFANIYPNLFIIWIAPTTLHRKTTSLDMAHGVARRVFPHLMAAQETTPEAFLSDLAGREPPQFEVLTDEDQANWRSGRNYAAQKGWVLDEISGLLAAAGKDYNAGLVESLLRFYDCIPSYARATRSQGRMVVRNAYLSMLGASTPAAMAKHLVAERLWSMGWWPRFAILTPEKPPEWQRVLADREPQELCSGLCRLYDRLPATTWPDPPEAATVMLADEVHDAWERYSKALSFDLLKAGEVEPHLNGIYGRLPAQALKVSIILAALDWPEAQESPRIQLSHLARAISICEDWRASAHRALAIARVNEFSSLKDRIVRQLKRFGTDGATLRDLYKRMKDKKPHEIENVLNEMIKVGEIKAVKAGPGKKGGRPTKRFRLPTE